VTLGLENGQRLYSTGQQDAFNQVGAFGTHLNCCGVTKNLTTVTDIWTVVEPYLAAERLELDDLEMLGAGRGRMLRVVIDGEGVNTDRLAEVSRGISRLLDNQTDLEDAYQLEVSSPGLERSLRRPEHYRKAIGREVVVKLSTDGGQKATVRGLLTDAGSESFTVDRDGEPVVIGYEDVLTAKTVFRWEKAPKPGH
jgi:ribosome maturation factor RimP